MASIPARSTTSNTLATPVGPTAQESFAGSSVWEASTAQEESVWESSVWESDDDVRARVFAEGCGKGRERFPTQIDPCLC